MPRIPLYRHCYLDLEPAQPYSGIFQFSISRCKFSRFYSFTAEMRQHHGSRCTGVAIGIWNQHGRTAGYSISQYSAVNSPDFTAEMGPCHESRCNGVASVELPKLNVPEWFTTYDVPTFAAIDSVRMTHAMDTLYRSASTNIVIFSDRGKAGK